MKINPILAIDSYKLAHITMYPENIIGTYLNLTPRSIRHFEKLIPPQFKYDNGGKESVYDQSDLANKVPVGYAIQGELIGPKIQANHEKVTELQYYVFDVFNISEQRYLLPQERRDFCRTLGIPHVPVMNVEATPLQLTLDQLLQHVDTESMNPKTVSEGRVYKSNTNPLLSFKVINNRYLLKHEA